MTDPDLLLKLNRLRDEREYPGIHNHQRGSAQRKKLKAGRGYHLLARKDLASKK